MVTGGKANAVNQLEEVIAAYEARKGARRSLLQVATFFPHVDHSRSAQRGFPCLQHVTFTPTKEGGLNVNAFYASQYLCERGYGNYLGLARLGKFVAHELKLPLHRLTCLIGVAELETSKNQVLSVLSALDAEGGENES